MGLLPAISRVITPLIRVITSLIPIIPWTWWRRCDLWITLYRPHLSRTHVQDLGVQPTWTYLWHHKIYLSRIYLPLQRKATDLVSEILGQAQWVLESPGYLYHCWALPVNALPPKKRPKYRNTSKVSLRRKKNKKRVFGPGHANNLWHQLQMILQFLRVRTLPYSDIWTEASATKMRSTSGCKQHAGMYAISMPFMLHICTISSYSITFQCV